MWQYEVLQNWGFGSTTFVLDFYDSSYPLQTNQGRWMNALIDFHVDAIVKHKVKFKLNMGGASHVTVT